jgi:secreted PhoX family phosphatase
MENPQATTEASRRRFLRGAAVAGVAALGYPMVANALQMSASKRPTQFGRVQPADEAWLATQPPDVLFRM